MTCFHCHTPNAYALPIHKPIRGNPMPTCHACGRPLGGEALEHRRRDFQRNYQAEESANDPLHGLKAGYPRLPGNRKREGRV